MKPLLYIYEFTEQPNVSDLFAVLSSGQTILGIWRGGALRWVCEAFKPLVLEEMIDVRFSSMKAEDYWDSIGTAQEAFRAMAADFPRKMTGE